MAVAGMGCLRERGLVEGLLDLDGLAGVDEPVHVGGHLPLRLGVLRLARPGAPSLALATRECQG